MVVSGLLRLRWLQKLNLHDINLKLQSGEEEWFEYILESGHPCKLLVSEK